MAEELRLAVAREDFARAAAVQKELARDERAAERARDELDSRESAFAGDEEAADDDDDEEDPWKDRGWGEYGGGNGGEDRWA